VHAEFPVPAVSTISNPSDWKKFQREPRDADSACSNSADFLAVADRKCPSRLLMLRRASNR
jgi:hypothetical protein